MGNDGLVSVNEDGLDPAVLSVVVLASAAVVLRSGEDDGGEAEEGHGETEHGWSGGRVSGLRLEERN